MWKAIYAKYRETYLDNIFQENALKESKIRIFNEDGNEKVVLQNEEVLTQLKAMSGHATWNMLKRQQNVINLSPHSCLIIFHAMGDSLDDMASIWSCGMGVGGALGSFGKNVTKANVLQSQSVNMLQ